MEQKFNAHRADFETLVKMFREDSKLYRVDLEKGAFVAFEKRADLPEQRLSEYKQILSKLNIQHVVRYENRSDIYLSVWDNPNFFIGGKSKYFVYSQTEIPNTVKSLDEIYRTGEEFNKTKKIQGNWYLNLDVW